jgi:hypothetical protein
VLSPSSLQELHRKLFSISVLEQPVRAIGDLIIAPVPAANQAMGIIGLPFNTHPKPQETTGKGWGND